MANTFENELWDKPNAITTFSDNNSIIFDKIQKFIGDFCKTQSININNHKRLFEKFLSDNIDLKNSDFSFNNYNYFITEKLLEALNIQETFNDVLLKEVEETNKDKVTNIKKETKNWKNHKRKLIDDLNKEISKHDSEYKRYCSRYNAKEMAHAAYLKAEENKSLSRNQVDNFHKAYLNRKSEYEQTKSDYSTLLGNFNQYQLNHYSVNLPSWSNKGEEIELSRYEVLKSTFTNLSEFCRSLASKFLEMAEKIETESEKIDCKKDCLNLIYKEKTGEIPPGAIPFKDFDVDIQVDLTPQVKNASLNSNSSTAANGKKKNSITEVKLRNEDSGSSSNIATNINSSNGSSNGLSMTSSKTFSFSKLFGGTKKSKDSESQSKQSEIENLEAQLEEKLASNSTYEFNERVDQEIDDIKSKLNSLKSETNSIKKETSTRKISLFQSVRSSSRKASVDSTNDSNEISKTGTLLGRFNMKSNTEKRRSRSVSSLYRNHNELNNNDNPSEQLEALQTSDARESIGKSISKSNNKMQSKSKRKETPSVCSRTIEVIRNTGPVEIVSTPAEAMAGIGNKSNSIYASEYEFDVDLNNQNTTVSELHDESQSYKYYYIGSCVAIHEYTTSDPSNIYLSFNTGQQFYIIQEDTDGLSNGWLLVEKIDKSGFGYVPESYMDIRKFDDPVVMYSNHPMVMT